jgi:hypothetical protein
MVDGQSITYDRQQLLNERDYWVRKAEKQAGKRRRFRSFDLGSVGV